MSQVVLKLKRLICCCSCWWWWCWWRCGTLLDNHRCRFVENSQIDRFDSRRIVVDQSRCQSLYLWSCKVLVNTGKSGMYRRCQFLTNQCISLRLQDELPTICKYVEIYLLCTFYSFRCLKLTAEQRKGVVSVWKASVALPLNWVLTANTNKIIISAFANTDYL